MFDGINVTVDPSSCFIQWNGLLPMCSGLFGKIENKFVALNYT